MQEAIASLARAASSIESKELEDAVHNAREAAGMEDPEHVNDSDDDCEEFGESAAQSQHTMPSIGNQQRTTGIVNMPESTAAEKFPSFSLTTYQENHLTEMVREIWTQSEEAGSKRQQSGYQSGRMSPGLTYGLFLERPLFRLTSPPVDIMPFLESSTKLSNVVFWTALVWGFRLLQATLNGDEQAAATAQKIFGEIGPMKPDRTIMNGIHARLKYRELGYVESDHPGYDPEGGIRIKTMMARTCEAKGTSLDAFLRPHEAEVYIKNRLGEGYRVVELGLQGLGTPEKLSRVRLLVDKMIRSSVCMGDGPRWRHDQLQKTVESWLGNSVMEGR